tara:strand:+ start:4071 stop:5618 length:1548 start_codon:yes stop_codon:yes gene_type:complete
MKIFLILTSMINKKMITSFSPYKEKFTHYINNDEEKIKINKLTDNKRKTVVVQGLGFVGSAMVAVLTQLKDIKGDLVYNVVGVDVGNEQNYWKIARANSGKSPILSSDNNMSEAYFKIKENKNFLATYSDFAYSKADFVVVDLNLDIQKKNLGDTYNYNFSFEEYKKAIKIVADNIKENTTVIIETTVPPGTTEKIIFPIFKESLENRNMDINKFYLAHAPERVMPGANYLNSIKNYSRVFSGINSNSKNRAKNFLMSYIDVNTYPLVELHSTTASEMAKVLENSYRATNIAFIQEWTEYAEKANVNLYEIINAIKERETHNNIMSPGFGVGGYCLTKDPLLADWSYRNFYFGERHLDMSLKAININDLMPDYTFKLLKKNFKSLGNINLAVLGVSYLNDVADTRYSPTEYFYNKCIENKINIHLHDPMVSYWKEKDLTINQDLISLADKNIDVVIFAVRHKEYLNLDIKKFLSYFKNLKLIIDGFDIISDSLAKKLKENKVDIQGVGKAYWKIK